MDTFLRSLIDFDRSDLDSEGVVVTRSRRLKEDVATSKEAWEHLYDFSLEQLERDRRQFQADKLEDHVRIVERFATFTQDSVYLEIGCGPSYIGEYLMERHNSWFIGVDFNYDLLKTLKTYFDQRGFTKYLLIHGDITTMPLKANSVDYIYGGGVIEHLRDTKEVVAELYRVLKPNGVSFNSVPALNLWWVFRVWNNIPNGFFRPLFEFVHYTLLRGAVLRRAYGHELSFTAAQLKSIHRKSGFRDITVGPMAFHPSGEKLGNQTLRQLYFWLQQQMATAAVYYCAAKK